MEIRTASGIGHGYILPSPPRFTLAPQGAMGLVPLVLDQPFGRNRAPGQGLPAPDSRLRSAAADTTGLFPRWSTTRVNRSGRL